VRLRSHGYPPTCYACWHMDEELKILAEELQAVVDAELTEATDGLSSELEIIDAGLKYGTAS
jgi:hypothetical protein